MSLEWLSVIDRWRGDRFYRPGHFSGDCKTQLARRGLNRETIDRLEALCQLSDYGNTAEHVDQRRAVNRILRRRGVRQLRGKRAAPNMVAFVDRCHRLLLDAGVPFRSGENSRLVVILRDIAADLNMTGDPRDQLRAIARKNARSDQVARELVADIFRKILRPPAST